MKLSAERESLLTPLQAVIGVVERRQTMPILANLLLVAKDGVLSVTATDLEVELVAVADVTVDSPGEVTVPGRKLLDICRALPSDAEVSISQSGEKLNIKSGRSKFSLTTLPAAEFPTVDDINAGHSVTVAQSVLARLLEKTHFSMAQQDVRYFFNGVLLEVLDGIVRFVATNGQRLATSFVNKSVEGSHQFIIPRKGVAELVRVLDEGSGELVTLNFTANHMQVELGNVRLISKLIDASYPDYARAIPSNGSKVFTADRQLLKEALSRTSILSNELNRNVRLKLHNGKLDMYANNPQQEEAEETVTVEYEGDGLEIGFNVSYLIDALAAMKGDEVKMTFSDPGSACLLEDMGEPESLYVISPMVL